jgi:NTE family protein
VINATNVQTGSLWRFSKPFMGDYRVGLWSNPIVRLAVAVAASSAFPPVLSPCLLEIDDPPDPIEAGETPPVYSTPPYTTQVVLSDGGVYDNLGLETAFKRYTTLLVSDGGMKMSPDPTPHEDWGLHSKRIVDLIDNQVRSLRKRQLIDAFVKKDRTGAYWGVATHLADYHLHDEPGRPADPFGYLAPAKPAWKDTADLAATPTRLAALESLRQEALINWGYVVCDTALRAHAEADLKTKYDITVASANGLPYPNPA